MNFLFLTSLVAFVSTAAGLWCDRSPPTLSVPRTPGDNGYKILVSGDPDKYIPGAVYTVRLQGPGDSVEKFSGFLLVAEPSDGQSPEVSGGSFQLKTNSLARFSEFCPHAVKHASELPKAEVQVHWMAPPASAGCVTFKGTVIKDKGHWFMDDGYLTKQLCPEMEDGQDEGELSGEPCCACDEAKYELTFEGLWSALTHPKDFPADAWIAHFSDIIGASHSGSFRFWEYEGVSSEGLRHIAESGDPRDLESELKDQSGNIRTIIKARGLKHPNFYGHKTFAVFRADKDHNLISLVSKIAPSPDWFVGVSGLNLCLKNCSWVMEKTINLFPFDAGTDNGVTYLAAREPTIPRDRIRRITWKSDKNSPFYDANGNTVKPFARLRIQKLRAYERACENDMREGNSNKEEDEDDDLFDEAEDRDRPECGVRVWSPWSSCSANCGKGVQRRTRQYVNEGKARDLGCNRKLFSEQNCSSTAGCKGPGRDYDYLTKHGGKAVGGQYGEYEASDPCGVSEWTSWSSCSASCGNGIMSRKRHFSYPELASRQSCSVQLREEENCQGTFTDCLETVEAGCETTMWSDWGPCSTTCGKGVQTQTRFYKDSTIDHRKCDLELVRSRTCDGIKVDCSAPEDMRDICMLPKKAGTCSENYSRWYFESVKLRCQKFIFTGCKGNKNNFHTETECEGSCGLFKESQTEPHRHYGSGHHQSQHGKWQPAYQNHNYQKSPSYSDGPRLDCVVSDWSHWTRCSVTCGRGHKYRTRYIKVAEENGGLPCPKLEHRRKCKGTNCPLNHPYRYQDMDDYQSFH